MTTHPQRTLLLPLLAAKEPWEELDRLAVEWSEDLAEECVRRFADLDEVGRKRLIFLLERVGDDRAKAVLIRWLDDARGDAAVRILRTLNAIGAAVPSSLIERRFDDATTEAVVAAGLSRDPSFAPRVATFLGQRNVARHAALALAKLDRREYSAEIASQIATMNGVDADGLIVALEVMNDRSVVPALRELMSNPDIECHWSLHHALWRLTGHEPLVRWARSPEDARRAISEAWRSFVPDAERAPRRTATAIEPGGLCATFDLIDGVGSLRIDFDPPVPGSSSPRWLKSVFAGSERLYGIGSDCDTCETTLQLVGRSVDRAPGDPSRAERIRDALRDVNVLTEAVLDDLAPYLFSLRTGHYLLRLVDLDVDFVRGPEASWLTRRAAYRRSEDNENGEVPLDVRWPGTMHFQVVEPALGAIPTYGVLLPQSDLTTVRSEVIEDWRARIDAGEHPAALAMCWVERRTVRAEFPERFLIGVVLDGHHRLAAYAAAGRPARLLAICRLDDSWGPPSDRSRWIREAFDALASRSDREVRG